MREALDGFEAGVQIGGRRATNLRYADDIIMFAASESELQEMMDRVERACKKYELQIDSEETKVISHQRHRAISDVGTVFRNKWTYAYHGSLINKDGDCEKEIKSRLAKIYAIITQFKSIWQNHGIHNTTKVKQLKALVWPVATYGCKNWTLRKHDEQN